MSTWDEIKRLAADFQRTQASETLQKISDRNCIDIIKKLTDLNLIELIYSCDGKEFVTPACLLREIQDEIAFNNGRMQLHELASKLNVDYQHIEDKTKELVKLYPDEYSLILGQIIHSSYELTLTKYVRDRLVNTGQLTIADLSKSLDLPSDFLAGMVLDIIKNVCDDYVLSPDDRTYYTSDVMDRYQAIISGTLTAITKPTTIASLIKRLEIPEKIFNPSLDSLIKSGRLDAKVENRKYIPLVYSRKQNDYVDKFYSQNSYIEYELVSRMDIKQPKIFLNKRFPECIPLKSCCVHPNMIGQVESIIVETVSNNSWLDISTILPTSLESEDMELMIQNIFKKDKKLSLSCRIFNKVNVCSLGFITSCREYFTQMMKGRAEEHLKDGRLLEFFMGTQKRDRKDSTKKAKDNEENTVDVQLKKKQTKKDINEKSSQETNQNELKEQEEQTKLIEDNQGKENVQDVTQNDDDDRNEESSKARAAEQYAAKSSSSKKDRRDKKSKVEVNDSDEEQSSKKSKSAKKNSGGSQGREIKQKSTKKKYFAGKASQRINEESDEKNQAREVLKEKEPLVFMEFDLLVEKLKYKTRGIDDCSDEFLQSIISLIEIDLSKSYEKVARDIFDDFLRSQGEQKDEKSMGDESECIE